MLCTSDNLAYKFLCECKRLWELEPLERNRLTTVQAALVMNMIYNLDGKDFIAIRYLDLACHMAKALDLFGLLPSSTSVKSYRARTTTAWALCKWRAVPVACVLPRAAILSVRTYRFTAGCGLHYLLPPTEYREAASSPSARSQETPRILCSRPGAVSTIGTTNLTTHGP